MVYTSSQRLSGYTKAYQAAGMEVNPSLMEYSDYTVEGGYEAFMCIIKRNPDMTAAFVTNYEMTLGSIIAINELCSKYRGICRL